MRAQAASDTREIKAREDFAAGRFQEALDIFARLYAESLHPIYLRNIGRCYQGLRNPDRAIATFHDYLRKAKGITPDEKKEIEGFISEMEDLKRQREATAGATRGAATRPRSRPCRRRPSPRRARRPRPGRPRRHAPDDGARQPSSPIYTKWWFWTLVGAVVVGGGLGIAAATGTFDKTQNASCPASGFTCPR